MDDCDQKGEPNPRGRDAQWYLKACLALAQDSKLFQCHRLVKEYEELHPEHFQANLQAILPIISQTDRAVGCLSSVEDRAGWDLILDEDVKVWHRPAGRGFQALAMEYDMAADLNSVLALLNEVDLYCAWLPFVRANVELERLSRTETEAWLRIKAPPGLSSRDLHIKASAVDGLDEDGCVLLTIWSVGQGAEACGQSQDRRSEFEDNVENLRNSDGYSKTVRLLIEEAIIKFIPINEHRTKMIIKSCAKPQLPLDVVPQWLLQFVASKMAKVAMLQWEAQAQRVAPGATDARGNTHRRRMRQNHEFYEWMAGRVGAFFEGEAARGRKEEAEGTGRERGVEEEVGLAALGRKHASSSSVELAPSAALEQIRVLVT